MDRMGRLRSCRYLTGTRTWRSPHELSLRSHAHRHRRRPRPSAAPDSLGTTAQREHGSASSGRSSGPGQAHDRLPSLSGGSAFSTKGTLTMNLSRPRTGGAIALVAAFALLVSACSGGGKPKTEDTSSGGGGGNSGYTFAMITHETPGDTFWDRIKAGANQAAKDTGSTLKYSADPDATKQAVLIQNAIDSKVDGIATTLVTPDALIPTVKKAVAAGIPVDSFNSGLDFYQQAGSLVHFAADEKLAGQQAGAKAKAAGATKILCTIQQAGSVALEDRCKFFIDYSATTENIQVNGAYDSAVTSALQAKLAEDKDINW